MGTLPFVGALHARHRILSPYEATVRRLSDRLTLIRRPLRVLDAVRWGEEVERQFFATGAREPPRVTHDYYASRPLGFDPDSKRGELRSLEHDVLRALGPSDPASRILTRRCREYRRVVDLLACRGTPDFVRRSLQLYGRPGDRPRPGGPTLGAVADALCSKGFSDTSSLPEAMEAGDAATTLANRLSGYFGSSGVVRVSLAAGMSADAAAGGSALRLRGDARFTPAEVRLLEVHEGWVHLGTTLNARGQAVCSFLGHCTPSATSTQEGLAVLTELLSGVASPERLRRLAHRVVGIERAVSGAGFLDVYRYFEAEGYAPGDGYRFTARLFRGSLPDGCGPFTKDLCYLRGFLNVHAAARAACREGRAGLLPLLFCGKTAVEDLPDLARLAEAGWVSPPAYLPPPFAALDALANWFRASTGLVRLKSAGPNPFRSVG